MKKTINQNWKFAYCQDLHLAEKIDKSVFSPIALPHTFDLPYYGETSFFVGYGVYKKELTITEQDKQGKIFVEFLGAFQEAEVYINETRVGAHRGGYTAFLMDITDAVNVGINIMTVRVNNLWQSDLPPRAGEHLFCGGINRDVSLIIVPVAHMKWNGICVKSTINENVATITAEIEIESPDNNQLYVEILDSDNQLVCKQEMSVTSLAKAEFSIDNPNLWGINSPYLYTLKCRYGTEEETVKFGLRTIKFSEESGFFLNGEHVYLEGVNLHQDRGGWGDAGTKAGITRDLTMMKEAGFNFIRATTYPRHPFYAQECDRLGLLLWYEATFWGIGGFKDEGFWNASAMPTQEKDFEPFKRNCITALEEMIRDNKNSPSIIVWSMGNEIFFSKKSVMNEAKKIVQAMLDRTHELDSTRPAGVGGTQRCDFHLMGDITGLNGDGAVLFKKPKIPNVLSEYGSIISDRPGKYQTCYTAGAKEQLPWRCGRTLWCGFHHGSIADIGKMGIADLYRLPLRSYYCYREKLLGVPAPEFPKKGVAHHLKITADKNSINTDGTDDCMLTVTMMNSANEAIIDTRSVTLEILDGKGLFPTGKAWTMTKEKLTFLDGIGAIEMRAYHPSEIHIKASAEGVLADEIIVMATGSNNHGPEVDYPTCPIATTIVATESVDLLLNRPAWVESEADGHSGFMANDGNADTYWCPKDNCENPYWIIDMENIYQIKRLVLSTGNTPLKFTLEISRDKNNWEKICGTSYFKKKYKNKTINFKSHTGRYLKVSFSTSKVKLSNIQAYL